MQKNVFGKQLKRDTNERRSLFKGLISSLILTGRIKTTEAKAKAIRGDVDKIITKAKRGEDARRILQSYLLIDAVEKVLFEIAPRFAKRQGGYSRIVRIGRRLSDKAPMVLMEWVEGNKVASEKLKVQNSDKKPATTEAQNKRETQNKKA